MPCRLIKMHWAKCKQSMTSAIVDTNLINLYSCFLLSYSNHD